VSIIEATISESGHVTQVRMVKAVPPEMERLIFDAVEQWTFERATLHGKPVPVYYNATITIHFR
jgi:hypothetical protein